MPSFDCDFSSSLIQSHVRMGQSSSPRPTAGHVGARQVRPAARAAREAAGGPGFRHVCVSAEARGFPSNRFNELMDSNDMPVEGPPAEADAEARGEGSPHGPTRPAELRAPIEGSCAERPTDIRTRCGSDLESAWIGVGVRSGAVGAARGALALQAWVGGGSVHRCLILSHPTRTQPCMGALGSVWMCTGPGGTAVGAIGTSPNQVRAGRRRAKEAGGSLGGGRARGTEPAASRTGRGVIRKPSKRTGPTTRDRELGSGAGRVQSAGTAEEAGATGDGLRAVSVLVVGFGRARRPVAAKRKTMKTL